MDPYNKGLRISAILHGVLVLGIFLAIAWSQLKPRTTETFTLVAGPPKGMIAGGMAAAEPKAQQTAPQAPKLAEPPKAEQKAPEATKPQPLAYKTNLRPQSPPKEQPKPKPVPKPQTPKQIQPPPPKKISFADYKKEHADSLDKQKAYYDKVAKAQKTQPKKQSTDDFASQLSKRLNTLEASQGATQRKSTPGSGEMGNGTAGATQDLERLYSSTLHQYLNSLWNEPRDLGGAHLRAEVEFTVDRLGQIKSWRIKRGSGVSEFDRSVASVFERTKTVPQPPQATEYRLSVTFETRNG